MHMNSNQRSRTTSKRRRGIPSLSERITNHLKQQLSHLVLANSKTMKLRSNIEAKKIYRSPSYSIGKFAPSEKKNEISPGPQDVNYYHKSVQCEEFLPHTEWKHDKSCWTCWFRRGRGDTWPSSI